MGPALSDVERGQVDALIAERFATADGNALSIPPAMATVCAQLLSNFTARAPPVEGLDSEPGE